MKRSIRFPLLVLGMALCLALLCGAAWAAAPSDGSVTWEGDGLHFADGVLLIDHDENGVSYSATETFRSEYGSAVSSVVFAEGTTVIAPSAVTSLPMTAVTIPYGVTEIGDYAFICVILPEETESIGRNAFADCPNLAYIYIPENTTVIDALAFGERDELIVFGRAGSAAESYAVDHGFIFIEGFPGN